MVYCDESNVYACSRSDCNRGQTGTLAAADLQIRNFEKPALGLVAPTVTVTATPTRAAPIQSSHPEHCNSDSGKLAGVGVGIGIPLLLAFLTTLYLLRRSMKRQKGMVVAREQEEAKLQSEPMMVREDKPSHELPENATNLELPPHVMVHEMSNGRTDQRSS
ncbi:MAG: hypothetical protein L6R41_008250 [Letrouitia leprolyta]|nr:MAG: hypothetical protein L6R41_008250 [Letrouitia leprolyta]